jgi:hypothetical protein
MALVDVGMHRIRDLELRVTAPLHRDLPQCALNLERADSDRASIDQDVRAERVASGAAELKRLRKPRAIGRRKIYGRKFPTPLARRQLCRPLRSKQLSPEAPEDGRPLPIRRQSFPTTQVRAVVDHLDRTISNIVPEASKTPLHRSQSQPEDGRLVRDF